MHRALKMALVLLCSTRFLANDRLACQKLRLVDDCASAAACGRSAVRQIGFLVSVLDMTLDCCMHWMQQRVSQYRDWEWVGNDQVCCQIWVGQVAKELWWPVDDGRSRNKEYSTSAHIGGHMYELKKLITGDIITTFMINKELTWPIALRIINQLLR